MSESTLPAGHCIPSIDGYSIHQPLHLGRHTQVYRGTRHADGQPVVLKWPSSDHPSIQDLLRLHNHYTLTHNLHLSGVVRPLSLESCGHGFVLVMPDEGYIPLPEYIAKHSLNLEDGLAIALQLATILHDLSQHRIIHKDIKPANILIHPQSKHIQLIDFCLASCLPKETQEVRHPNVLEGTLAYLAPEQTGRMNRGIDFRSDFYALGVTLFELLTGQLPFQSADPLDLVHCHLAKPAPSVCDVKPTLPAPIGQIVAKLMAKNAEDRYQSALGLKYDLEIALHQLQNTGSIEAFEIGSRDRSDRFLISEKLYGREEEVTALLTAFERASSGNTELFLVAGFSGIGKTAVVNEVHKPIVKQRGYFIKGKYDQFQRNIPLSAFVQAFRNLLSQLLGESDVQLQTWKDNILTAMGENGQVLVDVIPELEHIIAKQPPAVELSSSAAQNRFNLLMQKFVQVFTCAEHPLVIFLDDLQWADSASLKLLQLLMQDTRYLLVIGAYRDNEVSSAHPLMMTISEIEKASARVHTIMLPPLNLETLNQLVADTLKCKPNLTQSLTESIYQRTKGNPFFTTQFLKALYEDEQIAFDLETGYWQQNQYSHGRALLFTDDVVEFMALQLQKLPTGTQKILYLAACIGAKFDLKTLAVVSETTPKQTALMLWEALQEGLVLPISDTYKFFTESGHPFDPHFAVDATYQFLHDRVQQAAYSLLADNHRQAIHLKIGQLLLRNTSAIEEGEQLFEIVNHLNMGRSLMENPQERMELANLNLMAGRKAKTSTAYETAIDYLATGISLLPKNAWDCHYDLILTLHTESAEVAYLHTDFEQMEQSITLVLQHAKTLLDTIKVQQTRLMGAKAQGQLLASLQIGLQVLKSLDIEFPDQPTQADIGQAFTHVRQMWEGRSPQSLLELPTMTDLHHLAALDMMTEMVSSAYMANPPLMPLITLKQVELSIQFGNCPASIFAYVDYGLILCGVIGDVISGYNFAQLALQLLDRLQSISSKSRVLLVCHTFIYHWKNPLKESLPRVREAIQIGLETGEFEAASINAATYTYYAYHAGLKLTELVDEMEVYGHMTRQLKQAVPHTYQIIHQQTVYNLLGHTENPAQLTGTAFNLAESLSLMQATNHRPALFYIHLQQMTLSYLFGQYQQAAQQAICTQPYLDGVMGNFVLPVYFFYYSLVELALYRDKSAEEQKPILERVEIHQGKLQGWAILAACNHQHRWELVEAERHRVLFEQVAAMEQYDRAIASAHKNSFIQDEALANELAAKFYLDWGKEKIAQIYMTEAYDGYTRWGAKAKTDHLMEHYPHLLKSIGQKQPHSFNSGEMNISEISQTALSTTNNSLSEALDLTTILKASQSLSREIALEKLLSTLLQVLIENAGADKCVLLMPKDNHWVIEALFQLGKTEIILQSIPIEDHQTVPVSLINTIKRTQTPTVIDNALLDSRLGSDPYILVQGPKSILCTPILNQGQLIGILYLENNLTIGTFTRDRLLILELLCAQAAISLNNARLYASVKDSELRLEQQVKERTQALEAANQELSRLATVDALTQIANRRSFDQHLTREWQRHLREQQTLSLILIDIDYFKRYNDHYGHPAGDDCLFRVAQALVPILKRSPDLLARYGGEEFGAILPNTPAAGALRVAELMQQAIADLAVPHAGSEVKPFVTISMGVASLIPSQHNRAEILISQADQALYKAKRQGRNRAIAWVEPPIISSAPTPTNQSAPFMKSTP